MMIEVQGGVVVNITATQECSVYIVDHDNIKERDESTDNARQAMQPDCITWEEGEDNTPVFDSYLNESLSEYERGGNHDR